MRLEFREGHFDRVEVRTVRREEQEPGPDLSEALGCALTFVDGQIVEDHDIAFGQGRSQLCLHPCIEGSPIHGLVDDPWCCQFIGARGCNEGLRSPMAERSAGMQALASTGAAPQTGHLCIDACLVDEDQPVRFKPHTRLAAVNPCPAAGPDIRACAFRRHQGFFYM